MLLLRSLSLLMAAVLVVCAIFAPLLAPTVPDRLSPEFVVVAPFEAWAYPLGTDFLGRDVLSRLIYGARSAVAVVITTVVLAAATGTMLGVVAGFGGRTGRMVDRLLVGPTAGVAGLPTWGRVLLSANIGIFAGLFFLALFGSGFINMVWVLALLSTPKVVLAVRNAVRGIKSLGGADTANGSWIASLPSRMTANIAVTVIITGSLQFKSVLLLESLFTFLGVGIPPDVHTWSSMAAGVVGGDTNFLWWAFWFPMASILATAIALHFLGGWVREILGSQAVALAGHPVGGAAPSGAKSRHVAGLLAIFLGCFGVHKFYLGNVKMGIVYLLCSTLGSVLVLPALVVLVVSVVEGIRYLITDDLRFQQLYIDRQRGQATNSE